MKLSDYFNLQGLVYGFFIIFFIIFIGKFGIGGLVLSPTNTWNIIFNIGLWFVLISFCMDKFFNAAEDKMTNRLKRKSK